MNINLSENTFKEIKKLLVKKPPIFKGRSVIKEPVCDVSFNAGWDACKEFYNITNDNPK